jgi:hypothetical protein
MFFPGSRYERQETYLVTRADGVQVAVVRLPLQRPGQLIGFHRRHEGERLDLIANHYLADPTAFWRLCDANNQMVPDALAAHDLIGVPAREG